MTPPFSSAAIIFAGLSLMALFASLLSQHPLAALQHDAEILRYALIITRAAG